MKRLLLIVALTSGCWAQSAGVGQIWTTVTGTLQSGATASGNGTALAVAGLGSATLMVNCSVACSGGTTINFEGSSDGTNYIALFGVQLGTNTIAATVLNQGTTITQWSVPIGGLQNIRARISGYSAGTITVTATAVASSYSPQVTNANSFIGGAAADGNSGTKSGATQRVVLATDQPQLTNKLLVTPDSVALPANQSVNEAQINGVTPLMGNGTTGTGSARVTISSDNTAFAVNAASTLNAETTKVIGTVRLQGNVGGVVDSAPQATAPANGLAAFGAGVNAEQTAATNGQAQRIVTDLVGKLITLPYANPENFVMGTTAAITDTTSTSTIASAGGSLRNYLTQCTATNSHASVDTFVKILDGATIIFEAFALHAGGGFVATFPTPLRGTAATAVNAQMVTTGANVIVSCSGYKGL